MVTELRSDADLKDAFGRSANHPVLIFKHSRSCPGSAHAFDELMDFLERNACDHGVIVVQNARRISDEVESRTGVQHQSPQALLLHEGRVVWHASHLEITAAVLERELAARQT